MIGRNDPCWCGSGKKYKKCHLAADRKASAEGVPPEPEPMVKDAREIDAMRRAGAFNGELMDYIRPFVRRGMATAEIDRLVYEYTVSHGHTPACLGYRGYPKSVCTSINDVVCHGIPSEEEILKDGDIVNVDLTTIVDGYYGDSSESFMVGEVSDEAKHLLTVAAHALLRGMEAVRPGARLADIARAIEPYVRSQGCSVVRQYTGHGIGAEFHEHFSVCHHVASSNDNVVLHPGMTLTIEPMINLGAYRVTTDSRDHWTVRTKDGSLSAQFEHTLLLTDSGVEALTLTPRQRAAGKVLIVEGLDI